MPMFTSWICVLVMILGLILYFWPPREPGRYGAKVNEIGRIMFWTGLAFTVAPLAWNSIHLGR